MAAPRVGEQLEVQDPLEGPEQDSGQVALCVYILFYIEYMYTSIKQILVVLQPECKHNF
jgi:hypothetical protein